MFRNILRLNFLWVQILDGSNLGDTRKTSLTCKLMITWNCAYKRLWRTTHASIVLVNLSISIFIYKKKYFINNILESYKASCKMVTNPWMTRWDATEDQSQMLLWSSGNGRAWRDHSKWLSSGQALHFWNKLNPMIFRRAFMKINKHMEVFM